MALTLPSAWRSRSILSRGLLALFLVAGLLVSVTVPASSANAASSGLRYHRGYSVQHGWLCYGWPNDAYHCTARWRLASGHFLSLNPHWVPSQGPASAPSKPAKPSTPVTPPPPPTDRIGTYAPGMEFCRSAVMFVASISQWTTPPGCYAHVYDPIPSQYPARPSWGWCNWWPEEVHPALPSTTALSLPGHSQPRVGAVVFFSGGVQGASAQGHYATVVGVSAGGYWVLISEMNFYWRGGGFGRVDYRYAHIGPGVSFRY